MARPVAPFAFSMRILGPINRAPDPTPDTVASRDASATDSRVDTTAAQLQLAELQKRAQSLQDRQLAMQLLLEDLDGPDAGQGDPACTAELEALQQQMNNLTALITAAEDEQEALRTVDLEEATQAASLQLSGALAAQEQYDRDVLLPHDRALAQAIAACDEWEWQERGDWMEQPLDISDRPEEPAAVSVPSLTVPHTVGGSTGVGAAQPQQWQHPTHHQQQQHIFQQQQEEDEDWSSFERSLASSSNDGAGPSSSSWHTQATSTSSSSHHQALQPPHGQAGSSSSGWGHAGASSSSGWGHAGASSSSGWGHAGASSSSHHHQALQPPHGHAGSSSGWGHAGASSSSGWGHAAASSSSGWGHAGASSSRAAPVQCGICFDSFAAPDMVAAQQPPEAQAGCSPCSSTGRCSHLFCRDCMRGYVQEKVQSRKYPIPCPHPGCGLGLGVDDIMTLLAQDIKGLQVFEFLIAEHLIDTSRRVYCPYKDCSVLLERPEPEEEMVDGAGNQEAPYECPSCHRQFCLSCGITGWHAGLTCRDFQTLPPELRSAEDAAVHHIARSRAWKRCPAAGCGHLVERSDGCNHMQCLCGCSFCYACGVPYTDTTPTAENSHGTPGCTCALFVVPEEVEEEEEEEEDGDDFAGLQQQLQVQPRLGGMRFIGGHVHAAQPAWPAPVVLHQANRRPRPWRNGRFVSRTRCRHSDSIYDCPNGPNRCWFWHDEDDEEEQG